MNKTPALDQLLGQLRSTAAQLDMPGFGAPASPAKGADFSSLLKASLEQTSQTQRHADSLAQAFEKNAPGVNLSDVMLSLQKANITFQEMVQVRDKLVSAYQDIMNMQI